MDDAGRLRQIEKLHKEVHYKKGLSRFLQQLGRNPLAYLDTFCKVCKVAYPCQTVEIIKRP